MCAVNPDHYRGFSNGAEVIDIIEHLPANRANSVKYLARAGRKDDELQDLSKALWYTAREILRIGGQEALDSAIKELPGQKAMSPSEEAVEILLNANDAAAFHPTFEELGESHQAEGAVYKDKDGDFWTWRDDEWLIFEVKYKKYGWYDGADPDSRYGPFTKTSLSPDEVK